MASVKIDVEFYQVLLFEIDAIVIEFVANCQLFTDLCFSSRSILEWNILDTLHVLFIASSEEWQGSRTEALAAVAEGVNGREGRGRERERIMDRTRISDRQLR